jgi:hypothetical protein
MASHWPQAMPRCWKTKRHLALTDAQDAEVLVFDLAA